MHLIETFIKNKENEKIINKIIIDENVEYAINENLEKVFAKNDLDYQAKCEKYDLDREKNLEQSVLIEKVKP